MEDSPIVYANKAFEAITLYSQSEIVGRNCRFLQGADRDQPELDRLRAAIRDREPVEVVLRNYRKGGQLFFNRLVVKPLLGPSGEVIYFLGVQYDVTRLVQAEAEIGRLNERLEFAEA